jgi:hypothetical protein
MSFGSLKLNRAADTAGDEHVSRIRTLCPCDFLKHAQSFVRLVLVKTH